MNEQMLPTMGSSASDRTSRHSPRRGSLRRFDRRTRNGAEPDPVAAVAVAKSATRPEEPGPDGRPGFSAAADAIATARPDIGATARPVPLDRQYRGHRLPASVGVTVLP